MTRPPPAVRPVGPLPPSVYWRRRAVVLLVPVVLLAVLVRACSGGASPKATPTLKSTPVATTASVAPPSTPAPGGSAAPTTARSLTSPAAPAATSAPCPAAQLKVTVVTDQPSYGASVNPVFAITVTNTGSKTCSVDLGSSSRVVTVSTSAGVKVWSSADCDEAGTMLTDLAGKAAAPRSLTWSRHASTTGSCGTAGMTQPAGTYVVGGMAGGVAAATQPFILR